MKRNVFILRNMLLFQIVIRNQCILVNQIVIVFIFLSLCSILVQNVVQHGEKKKVLFQRNIIGMKVRVNEKSNMVIKQLIAVELLKRKFFVA